MHTAQSNVNTDNLMECPTSTKLLIGTNDCTNSTFSGASFIGSLFTEVDRRTVKKGSSWSVKLPDLLNFLEHKIALKIPNYFIRKHTEKFLIICQQILFCALVLWSLNHYSIQ